MEIRQEIKFPTTQIELVEFIFFLKKKNFYRSYPTRHVRSLYFDTIGNKSLIDNLSGLLRRDKVRLRWYENEMSPIFLEVKSRYGRIQSKQKIKVNFLSQKFLNQTCSNEIRKKILEYIYYENFFDSRLIKYCFPNLFVKYEREYYEHDKIRVTIDKNINYKMVKLNKNINFYRNINYGKIVVEFKFPTYLKNTVVEMIRYFNFYPQRHSKYLVGMSKLGYCSYL